jgi:small-conductance mechanosensitive channel
LFCVLIHSLPETLRRAEERADDLEGKLKASEEAHQKAEKDDAGVEDLRQSLQAAENALSDREAQLIQRDNDIITRLETQSRRFSSNIILSYFYCRTKVIFDVDEILLCL